MSCATCGIQVITVLLQEEKLRAINQGVEPAEKKRGGGGLT